MTCNAIPDCPRIDGNAAYFGAGIDVAEADPNCCLLALRASVDGKGRVLAAELTPRLERSVAVENRAGAGGSLGLVVVSKAPSDGDTLAIAATGALVVNPHIPNASPIDPLRDLVPVARLIEIPIVVVANKYIGPKSILELTAKSWSDLVG